MTTTPEHPDLGEVISAATRYGVDKSAHDNAVLRAQVDMLTEVAQGAERDRAAALAALEASEEARLVVQGQLEAAEARYAAHMATHEPTPEPEPPRMLIGAAVGGNADPSYLEREAGQPLEVRRTYWDPTRDSGAVTKLTATAKADIAAGRIPFPSIKFPYSWEQMRAGAGDAWARGLADQLAALDAEVWISMHHEPNGDEPDILDWRAAQERLAPMFDRGQVHFAVSYTGYPELNQAEFAFSRTFPSGPIKGLFVDLYQRYGTTDAGLRWTPIDNQFAAVAAFAKSRGVPWGLTETGVTDEAIGQRPNALSEHLALADQHGAALFCYFDSDLNSKGSWRLAGDTAVRRAKRAQFIAALRTR